MRDTTRYRKENPDKAHARDAVYNAVHKRAEILSTLMMSREDLEDGTYTPADDRVAEELTDYYAALADSRASLADTYGE